MEQKLLSFLQALSFMYQGMHWKTRQGYQDHLLFQRLYEGTQEEIDKVAEKLIGIEGNTALKPVDSIKQAQEKLAEFCPDETLSDEYMNKAIMAEEKLVGYIGELMEAGQTDGVENLIQGIADLHEEHLYLLKQYAKKEAGVKETLAKLANTLDQKGYFVEADELDLILEGLDGQYR